MPKIDFNKVRSNAVAASEPIPVPNVKPQAAKSPAEEPKKVGRPPKGPNYHYTRIAIEPDVWLKMGYTKVETGENFTEQINNALRKYLNLEGRG